MQRVGALLLLAVAVALVGIGLNERRTTAFPLALAAAAVVFVDSGNRLTPSEVRLIFGEPDRVFRANPRALCWRYSEPGSGVAMCWGERREQAWISTSGEAARAVSAASLVGG